MAFGAFTLLFALLELALVRIGFVAIAAMGKRKRLFEITIQVTSHAGNLHVFSDQRIFRFGVVEILGGLPAFDVVALGTFVAKLAFVRIAVARRAIRRLAEEGFG